MIVYLKCFGGPHDKKKQWVDIQLHQGDCWRIPRRLPTMVLPGTFEPVLDTIAYECDIYIVETLTMPKKKYKFLRWSELEIEQLLDKLFLP